MRFLISFSFVLLPFMAVRAQQAGSIQSQPDSAFFPSLGIFQQRLFSFYEQTPGQVLFHPSSGYSLSQLEMARSQGNWRTLQQPEKSTKYQISSTGVSQVNQFKVWGDFRYTRRQEDSVGWRLRPEQNDVSPYYLANIQPGNWDTHDYQLKGAAGVRVSDHILLVAGARLQTGTYGRYNDPRPEISRYRLRLEGGIGYSISSASLVLSGIYGYGEETNKVSYQNQMNRSEGRPTYTAQDVMGYGFYRVVTETGINLREDLKIKGAAAVVQVGNINVTYMYQQKERDYSREIPVSGDISPYSPIGDVTQNEHCLVSSYQWGKTAVQRLAGLEFQSVSVKDFNRRIIQGNNYLGTHRTATLSYDEKRPAWEYGLSLNLRRDSRKDGTAAVNYLVQTARLQAEASKRINVGGNFLQVNGQVGYRADVGSKLTIGSQYNEFMRGVVLPDFAYYSSGLLEPGMSLGYGVKVKNVLLLPTLGYQWQKPMSVKAVPGAAYQPGQSRSTYWVQLNVHL